MSLFSWFKHAIPFVGLDLTDIGMWIYIIPSESVHRNNNKLYRGLMKHDASPRFAFQAKSNGGGLLWERNLTNVFVKF